MGRKKLQILNISKSKVLELRNLNSAYINMPIPCLRPSEAEIQMRWTHAKRAWQNLDVRSGYNKQQHPSFVPQGQISQKPLRNVVPLIMHTQLEPASGVLFAPQTNYYYFFFLNISKSNGFRA